MRCPSSGEINQGFGSGRRGAAESRVFPGRRSSVMAATVTARATATATAIASSTTEDRLTNCRPFPADIEAEILLRLPVKTLVRFKSACKSWYSLISSPQFQKDHFRRAQQNPPLLLALHSEQSESVDPSLIDYATLCFKAYNNNEDGTLTLINSFSKKVSERYYLPFMQSCLGLVCISPGRYGAEPILTCNPSTQELLTLPPIYRHKSVGFGYATSTQEFKVVGFFYAECDRTSFYPENDECAVFTLGTTHWRKVRSPPFQVEKGNAPFLHEAIHFLPYVNRGVKDTDYIAVFDIDTEEFRQGIRLPAYYYGLGDCEDHNIGILISRKFTRLSNLGGSLCLTFDFGELKCRLELWLLKDYDKADWVKGYTIDVSPVFPYPSFSFWAYPADNPVDESVLLSCTAEVGVKLLEYHPQDRIVKLKKDKKWAGTFFVESLYSLRGQ